MNQNLSVILVSYNSLATTHECLTRLKVAAQYCQTEINNQIEVIIVDNNSQDGSVQMIEKHFPEVKLIKQTENLGFGSANNLGMKIAQNDFFLLLNTDAYIEKDTLSKALHFFKQHPTCDVLGCRLTFKNHQLQPSVGFLPTPFKTAIWLLGFDAIPGVKSFFPSVHLRNPRFYNQRRRVEWVTGAFFMLKREVYDKTKGFDPEIFMYMEEVEWCIRIKKHHFNVYFTPSFSIVHLGGASSGFNLTVPLFREMAGLLYLYQKHYPTSLTYLRFIIVIGCLLRIIAFSLIGKFNRVPAYTKVLKMALAN